MSVSRRSRTPHRRIDDDESRRNLIESDELVRVQIEMSATKVAALDRLRKATSVRTRRELFDNALSLFERAVAEGQLGHRVAFIDEEGGFYKVVAMPALDTAFRPRAQKSPRLRKR
jgi:hypothetical protein